LFSSNVFDTFPSTAAALKLNKELPWHSPFPLLPSGFVKNTEKLNYGKERMYKLTVTAYDCGKNRASEDVLVKISVKPTCKPSWQGIKALIYSPARLRCVSLLNKRDPHRLQLSNGLFKLKGLLWCL